MVVEVVVVASLAIAIAKAIAIDLEGKVPLIVTLDQGILATARSVTTSLALLALILLEAVLGAAEAVQIA